MPHFVNHFRWSWAVNVGGARGVGRGSTSKGALPSKLRCSAKAGANKAEMFHLTSFSVTSNWRVALDGMVPLTPVLPYAIWGGTVSLRLSPTRMPCTPRSQPAHKGQEAGCLQVHARRRNMQICLWRTLSILPCPIRVGRKEASYCMHQPLWGSRHQNPVCSWVASSSQEISGSASQAAQCSAWQHSL